MAMAKIPMEGMNFLEGCFQMDEKNPGVRYIYIINGKKSLKKAVAEYDRLKNKYYEEQRVLREELSKKHG